MGDPKVEQEARSDQPGRLWYTIASLQTPAYTAIEGPIGVGKSTLARAIARRFDARLVVEPVEENPFLSEFYGDRDALAFQTQMFFLLNRFRQLEELNQPSLFDQRVVCDYLFQKDRIFASLTLSTDERVLYEQIYSMLAERVPTPDLVIVLQAPQEVLMERIAHRDRPFERAMDPAYIRQLASLYNDFFFNYQDTAKLVIQTEGFDFAQREEDVDVVLQTIASMSGGTQYLVAAHSASTPLEGAKL